MSIVREDWSAIEAIDQHFIIRDKAAIEERLAPLRIAEKRAQSDLRLKTGFALLAMGIGVGVACLGASYVIPPKIITAEKVVVQTRVERVEIPKIMEVTKIERIEIPKIIERPAPVPAPAQPPIAKPRSEAEFKNQPDFKNAQYSGLIQSYIEGDITFEGGKRFNHVSNADRKTRPELTGHYGYCSMSNPALARYTCYVWINERKEAI